MTVVNYSVQDVFDATHRVFVGARMVSRDASQRSAARRLVPTIRVLGAGASDRDTARCGDRARACRERAVGPRRSTLVLLALPLLIPWNVIGTIWVIFLRPDIGLLGHFSITRSESTSTTRRSRSRPGYR